MPNFLSPEAILDSLGGAFKGTLSLTNFDQSMWSAKIQDSEAAQILATHTNADVGALDVRKYLFEGTTKHKALCTAVRRAYTVHKERTKTFGKNGLRVLPNSTIAGYLIALDKEKGNIQNKLDCFISTYDDDVQTGMQRLGQLAPFATQLYPPVENLPGLFSVQYEDLLPFPDENSFGDMDPATLTRLQMNLEGSLRARAQLTFDEALNDFMGALGAVKHRLGARIDTLDEKDVKQVKLTSSVLSTPVVQAGMLRQFARGDWANKMGKVESVLHTVLLEHDLTKKPELLPKALGVVTELERRLLAS